MPDPKNAETDAAADAPLGAAEQRRARHARDLAAWDAALAGAREAVRDTSPPTPVPGPDGAPPRGDDGRGSGAR